MASDVGAGPNDGWESNVGSTYGSDDGMIVIDDDKWVLKWLVIARLVESSAL